MYLLTLVEASSETTVGVFSSVAKAEKALNEYASRYLEVEEPVVKNEYDEYAFGGRGDFFSIDKIEIDSLIVI